MKPVRTVIRTAWIVSAICAATWIAPPAEGKTLRWAARGVGVRYQRPSWALSTAMAAGPALEVRRIV